MSGAYEGLKAAIGEGRALVGVVGLGYVGLPLAHALHEGGLPILGFDIDRAKIDALGEGRNYLVHLGPEMTRTLAASGRFEATADFARLAEADVIIVCLPTPLGRHHEPDLSYVVKAGEQIGRTLRAGQLIALESTTYPGTTREDFLEAILAARPEGARGLECGRDFFVAFSPEREDPGRKSHSTRTIPKLVGGLDERSTELAAMLYEKGVERVVRVSSAEVAEAAKLLENIFRSVNIALVNEMKMILSAMGIDVWEVIAAASTKPFGFMPFYPGPGLGGHCIPIDPFYLTWKAKEFGHHTRFIELAGQINNAMPHYVIERVKDGLNESGRPLRGSKVLVLGLAYKPDVDDVRETPAAEIIKLLFEHGADVSYHDPHVPLFAGMRKYMEYRMHSVPLTPAALAEADCVLVVTNHKAIDWSLVAKHSRLVVDSRNALGRLLPIAGNYLQA